MNVLETAFKAHEQLKQQFFDIFAFDAEATISAASSSKAPSPAQKPDVEVELTAGELLTAKKAAVIRVDEQRKIALEALPSLAKSEIQAGAYGWHGCEFCYRSAAGGTICDICESQERDALNYNKFGEYSMPLEEAHFLPRRKRLKQYFRYLAQEAARPDAKESWREMALILQTASDEVSPATHQRAKFWQVLINYCDFYCLPETFTLTGDGRFNVSIVFYQNHLPISPCYHFSFTTTSMGAVRKLLSFGGSELTESDVRVQLSEF